MSGQNDELKRLLGSPSPGRGSEDNVMAPPLSVSKGYNFLVFYLLIYLIVDNNYYYFRQMYRNLVQHKAVLVILKLL